MSDLVIHVTNEQRQRIEKVAQERGFKAADDYLLALFELDAERDPDQAYFWTRQWQAGEQAADLDIAAGRVKTFDTMDDLITDLMSDDE
jgi:hypothetical protein